MSLMSVIERHRAPGECGRVIRLRRLIEQAPEEAASFSRPLQLQRIRRAPNRRAGRRKAPLAHASDMSHPIRAASFAGREARRSAAQSVV